MNLKSLKSKLNFNLSNRTMWVQKHAGKLAAGSKIIDIGAGTGRYRNFFAHCDYKTHDFAMTPDLNGKYTHIDYISDITAIPVEDQQFDCLLCTEVLEHIPEPIKAVAEMARIAKNGSLLLISAPLGSFLHQAPFHYYGGFTPFWYQKFLTEAGFSIISIERNGGFFSFFGQESRRFCSLLNPANTSKLGFLPCIFSITMWPLYFPLFNWFIPFIADSLDRLNLEKIATIGYHIVAQKRNA